MSNATLLKRKRARRAKLRQAMSVPVLPTLLTLGNAVCGLGSIALASQASTQPDNGNALYGASLLIFVAMLFDMLDGAAARLTKQCSQFGVQLDSLCDAVSFGVAPAFLLLQQHPQAYHPRVLLVIAALYLVCAVLRLARFNVESVTSDSHAWFSGLPSPGAAAVVASFSLVLAGESLLMPDWVRSLMAHEAAVSRLLRNALPVITLAVSILMVSRIRFPHIAHQSLLGRRRFKQLVQIIFAIGAVLSLGELAAPLLLSAYAGSAPLRAGWQRLRQRWAPPPPQQGEVAAEKPATRKPHRPEHVRDDGPRKPPPASPAIVSILLGRRRA
jgi:CDP-diacylglycerol--serine O-phosphatidyltransferase